jgi:hypothetical protein
MSLSVNTISVPVKSMLPSFHAAPLAVRTWLVVMRDGRREEGRFGASGRLGCGTNPRGSTTKAKAGLCPARPGSAPDEQVGESDQVHARARVLLTGGHEGVAGTDGGKQQER